MRFVPQFSHDANGMTADIIKQRLSRSSCCQHPLSDPTLLVAPPQTGQLKSAPPLAVM